MPRTENVFYNLVTDENSTTELLCNLMRFAAFRIPFLRLFLSEASASDVSWDDIDTQIDFSSCGRPDLCIQNERLAALIEVKVTPGLGLTENQPKGYLEYLLRGDVPERWLVFLVPRAWAHLEYLNSILSVTAESGGSAASLSNIHTRIIYWEDVVEIIEENDLGKLNPFLNDFCELITARIAPRPVVFSPREVLMLFSNEIPTALSNLQLLVDGVKGRCTICKVRPSASRSLCPEEYGMYFDDAQDKPVLWFGVWTTFWKEYGMPLCFGVSESWGAAVQSFLSSYKGPTKRFKKYIVGWISQEALASDNAIDSIWAQLSPIIEAGIAAGSSGGVSRYGIDKKPVS
jgi:hypothetical protein